MAGPVRLEAGCVQCVPDCLGREPLAILFCNALEDCLRSLSADRVRKLSSCSVVFLRRQLYGTWSS